MNRDQLLRRYGAVDYLRHCEGEHAVPGEQLGVAVELLRAIAKGLVADHAALAATLLDLMGAMPEDEEHIVHYAELCEEDLYISWSDTIPPSRLEEIRRRFRGQGRTLIPSTADKVRRANLDVLPEDQWPTEPGDGAR